MALRYILKENDPGLLKKSRVVNDFNKRLHTLLDDMRETLMDANGLGLAAPQVGVLRRVILIVDTTIEVGDGDSQECITEKVPSKEASSKERASQKDATKKDDSKEDAFPENQIVELINPEIIAKSGTQSGSEGCLSLPGIYGLVVRPDIVKVKAQDRNGNAFEIWGHGLTARALCHEIDHLNGVIFTSVAERLLTEDEIDKIAEERALEEEENKTGETV